MKKIILLGFVLLLALALLSIVSAVDSYCFWTMHDGEKTSDSYYTCRHTSCQVCVNEATKAYASWTRCGKQCDFSSDSEPNLSLNVNWPFADNGVYTKQSFFLDITTSKIASISLIDNIAGTQKSLCPNCREYKRTYTFKEGFNDITIRAMKGLEFKESSMEFFIDSKKPVISKTMPLPNKYAASLFRVFYDEANVQEIKLKYGNNLTGMKETILQGCESGRKKNCSIDVDLKEYDDQQIIYWFEIKDIANNVAVGKQVKIKVDETLPVIGFFSHTSGKGYINFNMTVVEKNFFKIEYMDNSVLTKPIWKTVCSSLKNGNCFKKIYFRTGEHDVDIRVSDKAGNYAFEHINFKM